MRWSQRFAFAIACLILAAPLSAQTHVSVVTYNIHKNQTATVAQIVDLIKQNTTGFVPIVALQEVKNSFLQSYVNEFQAAYPGTTWTYKFLGSYCDAGNTACWNQNIPPDQQYLYESANGVALFTAFPVVAPAQRTWIMAQDQYEMGRPIVQMRIRVADGVEANFFSLHAPVWDFPASQVTYSSLARSWAANNFTGLKLTGGDFNNVPGSGIYNGMTSNGYVDAWAQATGSTSGGETKGSSRFDYWFAKNDGETATALSAVVRQSTFSDHNPVFVVYDLGPASTTWQLSDTFDDGVVDYTVRWANAMFTGAQDTTINVAEPGGQLAIGPLKDSMTGTHYNGIRSQATYDFTDAQVTVELTRGTNLPDAQAMFAVGVDSNNYYRWSVSNSLVAQIKTTSLGKLDRYNVPYDPVAHRFLRIRQVNQPSPEVRFETAAAASGPWVLRWSEPWDTQIPVNRVMFELKAGTSAAVANPGSVTWDNFDASKQ